MRQVGGMGPLKSFAWVLSLLRSSPNKTVGVCADSGCCAIMQQIAAGTRLAFGATSGDFTVFDPSDFLYLGQCSRPFLPADETYPDSLWSICDH